MPDISSINKDEYSIKDNIRVSINSNRNSISLTNNVKSRNSKTNIVINKAAKIKEIKNNISKNTLNSNNIEGKDLSIFGTINTSKEKGLPHKPHLHRGKNKNKNSNNKYNASNEVQDANILEDKNKPIERSELSEEEKKLEIDSSNILNTKISEKINVINYESKNIEDNIIIFKETLNHNISSFNNNNLNKQKSFTSLNNFKDNKINSIKENRKTDKKSKSSKSRDESKDLSSLPLNEDNNNNNLTNFSIETTNLKKNLSQVTNYSTTKLDKRKYDPFIFFLEEFRQHNQSVKECNIEREAKGQWLKLDKETKKIYNMHADREKKLHKQMIKNVNSSNNINNKTTDQINTQSSLNLKRDKDNNDNNLINKETENNEKSSNNNNSNNNIN